MATKTKIAILQMGLAACLIAGGVGCNKGEEQVSPAGAVEPSRGGGTATGAAGNVAGSYTITSAANPGGGGGYQGSVSITPAGDIYKIAWTIPNSPPYSGVAILEGATLGVGWGMGAQYGVAVYTINGGKLTGRWATASSGTTAGTEVIEGPEGLSGTYKVVSAKAPAGGSYTGTVTITPTGATHSVQWNLSNGSFSGVGIRQGNLLIVGWGESGKGAGAVSYQVSGTSLTGVWATPGGTQLGSETITRR
ncbi:MAG: hypothetical protein HUU21_26645 [Polyangiaceae bacterium]|nr:hypothetical protein [Polyangiaceae bacterium]NUQ77130.1 hypothetical protein [Polyangiaceae bacterium]